MGPCTIRASSITARWPIKREFGACSSLAPMFSSLIGVGDEAEDATQERGPTVDTSAG